MDSSMLAARMLEWEQMKKQLDMLEAEIKAAVLEIGKTQTVGNVRVTFTNGRRSFDYETPGKTAPGEVVEKFTTVSLVTDWQAACEHADVSEDIIAQHTDKVLSTSWAEVCKAAGIEPVVVSQSEPSATVKLLA